MFFLSPDDQRVRLDDSFIRSFIGSVIHSTGLMMWLPKNCDVCNAMDHTATSVHPGYGLGHFACSCSGGVGWLLFPRWYLGSSELRRISWLSGNRSLDSRSAIPSFLPLCPSNQLIPRLVSVSAGRGNESFFPHRT